jgi:hypothetical protein
MTKQELDEVTEAVNEMYTLDEVYWSVVNMDWTVEMFRFFVKRILDKNRKK